MIIIPARLESSRLPEKMLLDISGLPLVVRTARQCMLETTDDVVVATDSDKIIEVCNRYNVKSVKTGKHDSGTDRVYEAAKILGLSDNEVVINVQGDCPYVHGDDLAMLGHHRALHNGDMITIARPIKDNIQKYDRSVVKVVANNFDEALYFSRAPIPSSGNLREHIGIYAYKLGTLRKFSESSRTNLELAEDIEHLRALEIGIGIHLISTRFTYLGVNTKRDLRMARDMAKKGKI